MWVVVKPDDTVVVRIVRAEMGQGTITGLAQLVAEELDADWSKVTYEHPGPAESVRRKRPWGSYSTGGSRGIRESHEYVRQGGAAARLMLIQAAANEWKVPASEITTDKGVLTHKASNRTLSYGKVADAASKLPVPEKPALKDPKDWKIAGKPMKRFRAADKVTGKQVYGADLKLPGMLNATIKELPGVRRQGEELRRRQGRRHEGREEGPAGRRDRRRGRGRHVVAGEGRARRAADRLGRRPERQGLQRHDHGDAEGRPRGPQAFVGNQNGDAKAAIAAAAKKVEAVYYYPYQNHAPMEPMNATARYTADKCEVWVPTQDGEASFAAALAASGLPADKVEVHMIDLGGGFGRRGAFQDYVHQAVRIAKEMPGTPIKLLWSREEDMVQGRYHPVMMAKLTGALDKDNNLTGLHIRLSGQSILASVRPQVVEQDKGRDPLTFQGLFQTGEHSFSYTIPNLLIDHAMRNPHVPPGFWRGVNINQNCIFMECFMDELAQAAGQDELEFRRKLLGSHPRNLAVLNAVAEKIGWGKPAPAGIHRGLAHMKAFNAYVAGAAEVSVDAGGKLKVHRIVAATDPTYAVNPAQIERQVAGSFVYGLSALYYQECTVKDGRIVESNFDTYDSMRIAQMPKVESIVIEGGGNGPWGGIGEPTICVAGPAVMNAYFKATGKRIRSFPLKNQNINMA